MLRVSVRYVAAHQTQLEYQEDQCCAQKRSEVPHFVQTASERNSKIVLRNSINLTGPFSIILRKETTQRRRLLPHFLNRGDVFFRLRISKIIHV